MLAKCTAIQALRLLLAEYICVENQVFEDVFIAVCKGMA